MPATALPRSRVSQLYLEPLHEPAFFAFFSRSSAEEPHRNSPMPIGMQVSHTGRNASGHVFCEGGRLSPIEQGGWRTLAPSAKPIWWRWHAASSTTHAWPWHAAATLGGKVVAPPQYWRSQPRGMSELFGDISIGKR